MHSAPVENREAEDSKKANKRQTLFSLKVRLWRSSAIRADGPASIFGTRGRLSLVSNWKRPSQSVFRESRGGSRLAECIVACHGIVICRGPKKTPSATSSHSLRESRQDLVVRETVGPYSTNPMNFIAA